MNIKITSLLCIMTSALGFKNLSGVEKELKLQKASNIAGRYDEPYLNVYDTLLRNGSLRGASFSGTLGALLLPYTYYMKPKYTGGHYALAGLSILASLGMCTHAAYK